MRARLTALLMLFTACAPSGCTQRSSAPPETRTQPESEPTTELSFKLPRFPGGAEVDTAALRGKVLLIDVWATWCDPCIDALPAYEKLLKEYGERGLEVYAISIDQDAQQIAKFIESSKLELPILHDQDATVAERTLKVQMVPTTFLVDRRGVIRHKHEGFSEGTLTALRRELEVLLAEAK